MDYKQIQDLIKAINKSNIGELSIQQGDFKIVIKQKKENIQTFVNPMAIAGQPAIAQPVVSSQVVANAAPSEVRESAEPSVPAQKQETTEATNHIIIRSPMIGTFYRKSSPDKPALVEVGTQVEVGQAVCIIEAMKLFNEIESEVSGKIVKVLVDDASPVEYDQPLFLLEP